MSNKGINEITQVSSQLNNLNNTPSIMDHSFDALPDVLPIGGCEMLNQPVELELDDEEKEKGKGNGQGTAVSAEKKGEGDK